MDNSSDLGKEPIEIQEKRARQKLFTEIAQVRDFVLSNLRRRFGSWLQEADLEDALQDALLSFLRYPDKVTEIRKPLGLLTLMARRRCYDLIRHRAKRRILSLPEYLTLTVPEDPPFSYSDLRMLLTKRERDVIDLRLETGLTLREIAETLSLPKSTVFDNFASGTKKIREHLGLPTEE
jgi:DNA-directed RNA polymerase specialized sigma24 family protein